MGRLLLFNQSFKTMCQSESTVGIVIVLILQAIFYSTTLVVGTIVAGFVLATKYPRPAVAVVTSTAIIGFAQQQWMSQLLY
jgi:hypothetical protein